MNYCIQCTDIVSGKVGSFAYDIEQYLRADKPGQFAAISPVFGGLVELFAWAKANKVDLFFKPVCWETNRIVGDTADEK